MSTATPPRLPQHAETQTMPLLDGMDIAFNNNPEPIQRVFSFHDDPLIIDENVDMLNDSNFFEIVPNLNMSTDAFGDHFGDIDDDEDIDNGPPI